MSKLDAMLAGLAAPGLHWLTGKVYAVNPDSTVTLQYRGGFIYNVGTLDQYTPAEGDVVHALSQEGTGTLILGSNNTPLTPPPENTPGTPVILNPVLGRTYNEVTQEWTSVVGIQGGDLIGAWTYDASSLRTTLLERVEIELFMVSGGPPEFATHANSTLSGPLTVSDYIWRVGAWTDWYPLPISWGDQLIAGGISGFAVVSSGQSGTYSGTGRVRLTPLSVTI
jgi:hypothetical protein